MFYTQRFPTATAIKEQIGTGTEAQWLQEGVDTATAGHTASTVAATTEVTTAAVIIPIIIAPTATTPPPTATATTPPPIATATTPPPTATAIPPATLSLTTATTQRLPPAPLWVNYSRSLQQAAPHD